MGQVAEIEHAQHAAGGVVGPDDGAVDAVAAVVDGDVVGCLVLVGQEPVGFKTGDNVLDVLLGHGIGETGEGSELVIGPDDGAVAESGGDSGEGGFALAAGLQRLG